MTEKTHGISQAINKLSYIGKHNKNNLNLCVARGAARRVPRLRRPREVYGDYASFGCPKLSYGKAAVSQLCIRVYIS